MSDPLYSENRLLKEARTLYGFFALFFVGLVVLLMGEYIAYRYFGFGLVPETGRGEGSLWSVISILVAICSILSGLCFIGWRCIGRRIDKGVHIVWFILLECILILMFVVGALVGAFSASLIHS